MSQLTSLYAIFRKSKHGFHALTFVSSFGRSLKSIEGHLMSHSNMDEVLRPVVLSFLCENHDNTRTHLTGISKISYIITMLCALTGQCAHQTCLQFEHVYDILGQRVQYIIMASRDPSPLGAALHEILSTKSPELCRVCGAVASPNLPPTGDTLSSKCDV